MIKKKLLNFGKKNHWFMSFMRKIINIIGKTQYLIFFFSNKIDDDLIIFESYMGRQYSCSPEAIYEEMLENKKCKSYHYIWCFTEPNKYLYLNKNRNTKVVKYKSKEYYKYYSRAKYWITNSRISENIIKKKNQIYIQCWHGTPLKKLGYDIKVNGSNAMNNIKDIRDKYKNDSKRYNYMISPSRFCTEKFISSFNLKNSNIILETGYPRNDKLYKYTNNDIKRIKQILKLPKDKKIILYAPTWRDNQHESGLGYTYKLNIDFDILQDKLSDEYIILFRTHYFVSNRIDLRKYKGFVYNVSNYDDINDLYIISDLLITDYSSVFFDYANLKKPMLFYMYDYDEYKNKLRDFYIDFKELPGPIVKNDSDLIKEIRQINDYQKKYGKKCLEFNKKYNYLDGNNCSKKVVEVILNGRYIIDNK